MAIQSVHKNIIIISLLAVLLCSLSLTIGYAIIYDGYILNATDSTFSSGSKEYSLSDKPFTYCKVPYAPIEDCLKHVGFGFGWNSENGTYVITDGTLTIEVKGGSRSVLKNGTEQLLSMPIQLQNGKYYAPEEFFEKVLGKKFMFQGRIRNKYVDKLFFIPNAEYFFLNSVRYDMDDSVIRYNDILYFPAQAVLEAFGIDVGWDATKNAWKIHRNGAIEYVQDDTDAIRQNNLGDRTAEGFLYHGQFYLNEKFLSKLSDVSMSVEGTVEECGFYKRDLLENTSIPDDYRVNAPMAYYNGCYTLGNWAMEILNIKKEDAVYYAQVVNALADQLPEVTTYSILVPNASEFYAPKHRAANQINGIRTAYSHLSNRVVPINATAALAAHADEKIYFATDHHWTQRGAYYAYRALNNYRGYKTPALSELKTKHISGYVGSFAGFMRGTPGEAFCRSHPDLLERFLPQVTVTGTAYADMNMTRSLGTIHAVDTRYNTYMTFISGDRPISRFETSNKNGKSVLIIKESYGNALATWAMNDYQTVYVLDPRKFNGFGGNHEVFRLKEFYNKFKFDDMIIVNYPVGMTSHLRQAIYNLIQ